MKKFLPAALTGCAAIGLTGSLVLQPLHIDWRDGSVELRDISSADTDGFRLRISSARLWSPISTAQAAENVTLQDLAVELGASTYRAKTVEIAGSSLGRQQIAALLSKDSKEPAATRFKSFAASSVTIPELIVETATLRGHRTMTLRNLVFSNGAGGKFAAVSIEGGVIKSSTEDGTFGAFNARNLDFNLLFGLYADGLYTDLSTLADAFSLTGFDTRTTQGAIFHVDRFESSDLRTRLGGLVVPPPTSADKNPRFAAPVAGNFVASGITMEFPNSAPLGGPHKWKVGQIAVAADRPINNIPSVFRIQAKDWVVETDPIASGSKSGGLRSLGYPDIHASFLLDGSWNRQSNDFNINNVTLDLAEIGAINLSGTLGQVGLDMFSGDSAKTAKAYAGITVKNMVLSFENKGVFERAIVVQSEKQRVGDADVKKSLQDAVLKVVPGLLGGAPSAKVVAKGVTDFFAKPTRLEFTLKSKAPGGVLLTDFKATGIAPAPSADKMDITALVK
jgi:hypothetical protein